MADKENSPPRKKHRYLCKFNDKMTQEYSEIRKSKKSDSFAYCVTCSVDISIGNGGKTDVKKHVGTPLQKQNARTLQTTNKITLFATTKRDT